MTEQPETIMPPMLYLPVQNDSEFEKVVALRRLGDGRTGAKWLWESAVPLHMRDALDNNMRTNASRNWIIWDDSPRIPR